MAAPVLSAWDGRSFPNPVQDGAAMLSAQGLPMRPVPSATASWSAGGLGEMNRAAAGAAAAFHELPQRPSYHTQQSIALQYSGIQRFPDDVFKQGQLVLCDTRSRDGTQRNPMKVMSLMEMNRFLRDDEAGRNFVSPTQVALSHIIVGKYHADQVEGNNAHHNLLGRDMVNPKRHLCFSAHISGCCEMFNYWGRFLSMGSMAYLCAKVFKKDLKSAAHKRAQVLALMCGAIGTRSSLEAIRRGEAEYKKDLMHSFVQIVPLVEGYTFSQRESFEAELRDPENAVWEIGRCVDNSASAQTTAAKGTEGIMYAPEVKWNKNWKGDLLVNILVRGPDLISCNPDLAEEYAATVDSLPGARHVAPMHTASRKRRVGVVYEKVGEGEADADEETKGMDRVEHGAKVDHVARRLAQCVRHVGIARDVFNDAIAHFGGARRGLGGGG